MEIIVLLLFVTMLAGQGFDEMKIRINRYNNRPDTHPDGDIKTLIGITGLLIIMLAAFITLQ